MKKDIRYTHKIDMEKLNNLTQEQIDNDECGVLGELVSVDTVDRREYSDKVEIDVGTIYLNRIKNGFEDVSDEEWDHINILIGDWDEDDWSQLVIDEIRKFPERWRDK
tara:strand:+ start:563 stop:886 length:324 start_codon:yes stop_codon:yes gene_type:complete